MGSGLMRHQDGAEHPFGFAFDLGDGLNDLDAAGFAAAAGMNLRLDHPDRPAEFVGGLFRLRRRECGNAARHRHAEFPQYRLGLIFVDVHSNARPNVAGRVRVTKNLFSQIGRDPLTGVDQRLHRLR
jgi:hypothetical protein